MSERHTFILSDDIWAGVKLTEIRATAELLKKHGLYQLPFDSFVYLQVSNKGYRKFVGQDTWEDNTIEMRLDEKEEIALITKVPFLKRAKARDEERRQQIESEKFAKTWAERGDAKQAAMCNHSAAEHQANIHLINALGITRCTLPDEIAIPYMAGAKNEHSELLKDLLIVTLRSKGSEKEITTLSGPRYALEGPQHNSEIITRVSLRRSHGADLGGSHASPRMHLRRGHEHIFRYGPRKALSKVKFVDAIWVNEDAEFETTRKAYNITA